MAGWPRAAAEDWPASPVGIRAQVWQGGARQSRVASAASPGTWTSLIAPAGDWAHPRRFPQQARLHLLPTLQTKELKVSRLMDLLVMMCPVPGGSCGQGHPTQHLREGGSRAGVYEPLPRLRMLCFSQKRKGAKENSPGSGTHTAGGGGWREGRGMAGTPGRQPAGAPPSAADLPDPAPIPGPGLATCPVPGGPQWGLWLPVWGFGVSQGLQVGRGREKMKPPLPHPSGNPSAHTPPPNAPAPGTNRCVPPAGRPGSWATAWSGAGAGAWEVTGQDPGVPAASSRSQSRATSQPWPWGARTSVPIVGAADPSLT